MKIQNLMGRKFGRLLVLEPPATIDGKKYRCRCVCDCGKETAPYYYSLIKNQAKSCGCLSAEMSSISGPERWNWKGGVQHTHGYRRILQPDGRYKMEHIIVMEQHLGRVLHPGENVHHKNGKRSDNRIENLELWVSSQPAGQRPEDLVVWAEEILRRYKP